MRTAAVAVVANAGETKPRARNGGKRERAPHGVLSLGRSVGYAVDGCNTTKLVLCCFVLCCVVWYTVCRRATDSNGFFAVAQSLLIQ